MSLVNRESLLTVIREHAFGEIALEKCLTIMPTEHGAKTPSHWEAQTDAYIATLLPEDVLRNELARRKAQSE